MDPLANPFLKVWTVENPYDMLSESSSHLYSVTKVVENVETENKKRAAPKRPRQPRLNPVRKKKPRITDNVQRVTFYDRKGKLTVTLHCMTCGAFVQKGMRHCRKCAENDALQNKGAAKVNNKRRIKYKTNEGATEKVKKATSAKVHKKITKPTDTNRKLSKKKESNTVVKKASAKKPQANKDKPKTVIRKQGVNRTPKLSKVVGNHKTKLHDVRCVQCKVNVASNKKGLCRKCSALARRKSEESKLKQKNTLEVIEILDDEEEAKKTKVVDKLQNIEECIDLDANTDTVDYVSFDDINKLLEDET